MDKNLKKAISNLKRSSKTIKESRNLKLFYNHAKDIDIVIKYLEENIDNK
jgi:hypothetical protein